MNRQTKTLLGLAAGALLIGGTAATTLAADPTPAPNGTATCGVGQGGGRWGGVMSPLDAVAKLLGVSETDIATQRQAGKSLAQVAADKGVAKDKLVQTMLADRQADLDKAVADGRMTKAQADYMLANMTSQVQTSVDRTTTGPVNGRGAMGGGRGMRTADGSAPVAGQGFGPRMGGGFGAGANR